MGKHRQPSGAFFRRVKSYSEPKPQPAPVEKPVTWIRGFKETDGWLWGEFFGFLGVVAALIAFFIDLEDRQTQRITQAWQLVTQPAPGNSGKGPALEYLNSQGIELVGIDLSTESNNGQSYLRGVNLSGAKLRDVNLSGAGLASADLSGAALNDADLSGADLLYADLSEAFLQSADLSGAYLRGANLSGAYLVNADLSGAKLYRADLSGAFLYGADLSGADLSDIPNAPDLREGTNSSGANLISGANLSRAFLDHANLSGADISGANLTDTEYLSQNQLDAACGDDETQLPQGFTVDPCPDE